jgi:hypothetical protein
MDKRYQGVIRGRKSMKDRKINGQKIPRGNKKAYINIFCPLFFLSFIDLRLLITPWYLLSIILSVLKSMKDRQSNGQKIPRGKKKA